MISFLKGARSRPSRTRIFFASDVHGSERCFRKWVNAAAVYDAGVLILGGDLTGKALVPLVEEGGTWRGELHGRTVVASSEPELQELRSRIRLLGFYDVIVSPDEAVALRDDAHRQEVFDGVIRRSVEGWLALVEERLGGRDVEVYMMLGNDDNPALADLLSQAPGIHYAEDGPFELPGGFEMIGVGPSTPTPWHTQREVSEEELALRIHAQVAKLAHPENAVFDVHNPPHDTHLDEAPVLDADLRPVVDANGPQVHAVGSHAVRAAIEEVQPLLGLHGHIHESPGSERIGRTLCLNPGSDYGQGVLRGVILDLEPGHGVRSWQVVQG